MQAITMVDLKGQYIHIKTEIDAAIQRVIDSTAFVNGNDVKQFQQEMSAYMGGAHTVACANGTDALQIALMALELQPGDEVISPDFTFASTVEVIALLGLKPVLVDVSPDTYTINPALIEKAITPRTKAIIPVHLYGQCADMTAILRIAQKHNLYVIEDTAQACGADYIFPDGSRKKAGTIGHIGSTSFFPSKNLGCYGDGGALFTNDETLAQRMSALTNHGSKRKYYQEYVGVNSRLDSIQAAILRVKLPYLDRYNAARRSAADFYDRAFANCKHIVRPYRAENSTHIFHQYTILVGTRRDELKQYLEQQGIPSMIYYPVPMHQQPAFAKFGFDASLYPYSAKFANETLSLPMHTELTTDQLEYIAKHVINFFER